MCGRHGPVRLRTLLAASSNAPAMLARAVGSATGNTNGARPGQRPGPIGERRGASGGRGPDGRRGMVRKGCAPVAMRQPVRGEEPPETVDPLLSEVRHLREVYEAILDALRAADRRFAAVEQQIAPSSGLVADGGASRQTRTRGGWTAPGEWELSGDAAVTGESLRQRREALGVSQAAIAHAAHCSRGLVAEVERGRRRSALTLNHLSQVLDRLEKDARRR